MNAPTRTSARTPPVIASAIGVRDERVNPRLVPGSGDGDGDAAWRNGKRGDAAAASASTVPVAISSRYPST